MSNTTDVELAVVDPNKVTGLEIVLLHNRILNNAYVFAAIYLIIHLTKLARLLLYFWHWLSTLDCSLHDSYINNNLCQLSSSWTEVLILKL